MTEIIHNARESMELTDYERAQYEAKYANDQDVLNLLIVISNLQALDGEDNVD